MQQLMNAAFKQLLVGFLVYCGVAHHCLMAAGLPIAPEKAYGFGAGSKGGVGGRELLVTSLADDPARPSEGTLRWAVAQQGPRIIRFRVAGNIRLQAPLEVREPFVTIDGSDAPGLGICLCDHSVVVKRTHDVIFRHIRVRRGDTTVLARNKREKVGRPKDSNDLDCINAEDSADLLFDHISASWSCDELFSIVRCRNVTIQWCLLAEPLSNPHLHPYGDNHAFCLNASASTLSVHHCLFAHYVMRGPQFEANDVRPDLGFDPKFEAVSNVMFDYQRSGSRYTTGIENNPEGAKGTTFQFQFVGNVYLDKRKRPEIFAERKHGESSAVRAFVAGNVGPHRERDEGDEWSVLFAGDVAMRDASRAVQKQIVERPLFETGAPVPRETTSQTLESVLKHVGCSCRRDATDLRIVEDVVNSRFGRIVRSQNDVGGWAELD